MEASITGSTKRFLDFLTACLLWAVQNAEVVDLRLDSMYTEKWLFLMYVSPYFMVILHGVQGRMCTLRAPLVPSRILSRHHLDITEWVQNIGSSAWILYPRSEVSCITNWSQGKIIRCWINTTRNRCSCNYARYVLLRIIWEESIHAR